MSKQTITTSNVDQIAAEVLDFAASKGKELNAGRPVEPLPNEDQIRQEFHTGLKTELLRTRARQLGMRCTQWLSLEELTQELKARELKEGQ